MAARSDDGLHILLGLCNENVDQIKADNPLMTQLSHCGARGLLFIYPSEDGTPSPQFQKALKLINR